MSRSSAQRGSVLLVVMMVMAAMLGVGSLAVMSARMGTRSVAHDRYQGQALYAAESGLAAGVEYLRSVRDPVDNWSLEVEPENTGVLPKNGITGNTIRPGQPGYPFSATSVSWYEVTILNNQGDPGYAAGDDEDARVILRSVGHGPDGATVVLEAEIAPGTAGAGTPCPGYAQKNADELGRATNPCLSNVNSTDTATFSAGGAP